MTPTFTGVHHVKFPVSDLPASLAWFNPPRMARPEGDHHDGDD